MEAEKIACADVCREVLSLRYGLEEMHLAQSYPTPVGQDSTSAIQVSMNPRSVITTLNGTITDGFFELVRYSSEEMHAEFLTKNLIGSYWSN